MTTQDAPSAVSRRAVSHIGKILATNMTTAGSYFAILVENPESTKGYVPNADGSIVIPVMVKYARSAKLGLQVTVLYEHDNVQRLHMAEQRVLNKLSPLTEEAHPNAVEWRKLNTQRISMVPEHGDHIRFADKISFDKIGKIRNFLVTTSGNKIFFIPNPKDGEDEAGVAAAFKPMCRISDWKSRVYELSRK